MKKSPCMTCNRVKCPAECENKQCKTWQQWFLQRWSNIHGFYEKHAGKGVHNELETGSH